MTITTVYQAVQNNVASLAQWTQDQLTTLAAGIAAGWNVEHDGEGHHTNVTVSSLVVNGATQLNGPIAFRNIVRVGLTASTSTTPLYVGIDGTPQTPGLPVANFNVLKIRPKTGADTIKGLDATGRQEGDRIVIFNIGNVDLNIALLDTTTPVGTAFIDDTTTTEATFGILVLGPAGWVEGMLLTHEFFAKQYWCLSGIRQ